MNARTRYARKIIRHRRTIPRTTRRYLRLIERSIIALRTGKAFAFKAQEDRDLLADFLEGDKELIARFQYELFHLHIDC